MNVRYWVELSQAERGELTAMLSKGKQAARKLKRAQILLAADAGCSDEEIARTLGFRRVCSLGSRIPTSCWDTASQTANPAKLIFVLFFFKHNDRR
jgi:hypothetical protein